MSLSLLKNLTRFFVSVAISVYETLLAPRSRLPDLRRRVADPRNLKVLSQGGALTADCQTARGVHIIMFDYL